MIYFVNCSSQNVIVEMNGQPLGGIAPGQKRCYDNAPAQSIAIVLRHQTESYRKAGAAHMQVETLYVLQEPKEHVEYIITREKLCFEYDGYYDRFFLLEGNTPVDASQYWVAGIEQLKKKYERSDIAWVLIEPLLDMLFDLGIWALIIPIALLIFAGWKWTLIILGAVYLLAVVWNQIGWLVADSLLSKLFKMKKEEPIEEKLIRWSNPNNIAAYYTMPDRKPHSGKVER